MLHSRRFLVRVTLIPSPFLHPSHRSILHFLIPLFLCPLSIIPQWCLAKWRAKRCQQNIAWMTGKCASAGAIPLGSLGAASMIYEELNDILRKFGVPATLQDASTTSRNPLMRDIQKSLYLLGQLAGADAGGLQPIVFVSIRHLTKLFEGRAL